MATDPLTYLPVVAWETKARKVRKISEWQYRISVSPDNINNKGAGKVEVGFLFMDNLGSQYSIPEVNVGGVTGDILLNDDFKCGRGPVPNRTGIVYRSVGDSLYLAQVMYSRLNNTAQDKGRAIDLAVLWDAISGSEVIQLTNATASIENYNSLYASKYGQYPKLMLFIDNAGNEEESQQVPIRYKTNGLITRIAWDIPDLITGKIIISK